MSVNIAVEEGHYDALNLTKDDVVLDVGACVGGFAKRYYKSCKKIYCFEPVPKNFRVCVENTRFCGNVQAHNIGVVGDADKERVINLDPVNRGAHTMYKEKSRGSVIRVRCVNINELISAYKPSKLKLDCEGAEYEIIKAVKDWSRIKGLIMEWHEFIHSQDRYEEIIKLLEAKGFKVTGPEHPVNQTVVTALR